MKKLSLLKPNKKTVYLENGKGQEVTYLHVPVELDKKALERDVKAGAVQFKDCLAYAEKKPSRIVLIDCRNEEEGLMAVSYLAGIHNHAENAYEDMEFHYDEEAAEEEPWYAAEDVKEYDLNDFQEWEEQGIFRDSDDEGEPDEPEGACWEESPCRIPIVTMSQLIQYANDNMSYFSEGPVFMGGQQNSRNRKPYWLTARKEPICVTINMSNGYGFGFGFAFGSNGDSGLVKAIKRFSKNRHVYVLVIGEPFAREDFEENSEDIEESWDSVGLNSTQQVISEMILEYTAGVVKVVCSAEERKRYYTLLFENWANEFGMKLEKRFPKREITEQIIAMQNEEKSALFEKVYRYVLSQEREGNILTKEDFTILKRFRALGVATSEKEKQKSIQKLDTTLVGMEEVKRQVHSIVNIMKFNKKREQMGLGKGSYHNVHLLIGAPGTAKTTVAQMLGNIMCEQKLLPGNRFIAINGADLKGMYVGHSAPKTKRYFDEYDIILIDEAYSLTTEQDMDSFSQEAIAQLIIELEKHGMDKLVMFAGYGGKNVSDKDNKMKQFLDANPGIRSRINSTIYFDSYTPEEMVEIVHCHAKNQKYILNHDADEMIRSFFAERVNAPDFGNGREARSLMENITRYAATRTARIPTEKLTKKLLQELTKEDVQAAVEQMQESYTMQKGQGRKKCGFVQGGNKIGCIS